MVQLNMKTLIFWKPAVKIEVNERQCHARYPVCYAVLLRNN